MSWKKLTDEQLQGANYALRLVHTSPRIRGGALELINGLINETTQEMSKRNGSASSENPQYGAAGER